MHSGAFNVFHDAGDEDVVAVGNDVDLQLDTRQVLVHKHRVLDTAGEDPLHIGDSLCLAAGDGHVLPADDVGGTQQDGVTQLLRRSDGFVHRADAHTSRAADAELLQEAVEALPILGNVDGFRTGAENPDALGIQELSQLDGCLAAEGDHDADGLLHGDDVHDILGSQGLKIEPVCGVIVGGNRLGIIVDDDHVIADAAQGPDAVDRGIVELDALADADRAGTQHDDHRPAGALQAPGFTGLVRAGIEVGCFRGEFRTAGVHHLVAELPAGDLLRAGEAFDGRIRIAHALEGFIIAGLQAGLFRTHLQLRHGAQAEEEEPVDLCDIKDLIHGNTLFQSFEDREEPVVVLTGKPLPDGFIRQGRCVQGVQGDFGAADSLHQSFLKALADGHDLAGCLHLGAQAAGRTVELVERPLRELHDDIVDSRLEAGAGLAGDIVGDLIQRVAKGDARGDLGDGIAGCFAGQCRGAADAGIDLDDRVFEGVRVQGELAVAAADDADGADDVERGGTEHLVLLVRQRQRRGDDNTVAGMDADRVHVLHGADGDHIPLRVTHGLELDLFPAGDALLNEDLGDGGGVEAAPGDLAHFFLVRGDAAAAAAQGVGGTHDHGIADLLCDGEGFFQRFRDAGGYAGLADGLHGITEFLPVLRLFDGVDGRAEKTDAEFVQRTVFTQLHGQSQTGLAAEAGDEAVRALFLNDAADSRRVQGLKIDLVRQVLIGHDGRRVGVHQYHVDAFRFQHAAGLGTGIVKLGRLTDDDRAGTDDNDLFDACIFRHLTSPSFPRSGRRGSRYPADRRRPPGGTGR